MNVYKFLSNSIKKKLAEVSELRDSLPEDIAIETPKIRDFGDFSTNTSKKGNVYYYDNKKILINTQKFSSS